ncbi:MAG: hemerythrin domain-containing protein [Woeseiaceae bacterium]
MALVMRLLYDEHADFSKLLDILMRQVAKCNEGTSPDYEIIEAVLDYSLSYPVLCHHTKEDLVYRKLRVRDAAATDAIGDLEADHEELALLTRRFAATFHQTLHQAGAQRDRLSHMIEDFVQFYRRHIDKEEKLFFPAALRTLTAEDWDEIDAQVTDHQDPLFGDKVSRRFRALLDDIVRLNRADARS